MNILIAVASRHGSTHEIAEHIAETLRASEIGSTVDVRDIDTATDMSVKHYDAVILGSAVYMGKWLPVARHFVERQQMTLANVPVWLFSSGPIGTETTQPSIDPKHVADLAGKTHALEHRVFAGKLDRSDLSLGERVTTKLVHAPEGDFRDWAAIRDWAREIAAAVQSRQAIAGRVMSDE